MSFAVTTQMDIYPEKLDEFLNCLGEIADCTREAAGCLIHNICVDAETKGRLLMFSAWESIEQYKAFLDWGNRSGVTEMIAEFMANPPVIRNYNRID